jgi:hypothetical protein
MNSMPGEQQAGTDPGQVGGHTPQEPVTTKPQGLVAPEPQPEVQVEAAVEEGEPPEEGTAAPSMEPSEEPEAASIAAGAQGAEEDLFGPRDGDDEETKKIKTALVSPQLLPEGVLLVHTATGRAGLAAASSSAHGTPCILDDAVFENLIVLLEACFLSVLEQKDFAHLSTFMGMTDKYGKAGPDGGVSIAADEQRIRDSPLWTDVGFWSEVREQSHICSPAPSASLRPHGLSCCTGGEVAGCGRDSSILIGGC